MASNDGTIGDCSKKKRPEKIAIITINDYDFDIHQCTLYVGNILEFKLGIDVPLHAEHIIEGRSMNAALNFISPLLQVKVNNFNMNGYRLSLDNLLLLRLMH